MGRNCIREYLFLFIFLLSCQMDKGGDQPEITFLKRGAEVFQDSNVLVMNLHYRDEHGDHLLDSATRNLPLHMPYFKVVWDTGGIFYQALSQCKVGDSAQFSLNAHQFYVGTFGLQKVPVDLNLSDESRIDFFLGISKQMTLEDFYVWQDSLEDANYNEYIENTEKRKIAQGQLIDEHIKKKGLEATVTGSGLRYVISEGGDGKVAQSGDFVTIHFHGSVLGGNVFGSSVADGQPYEFELGSGEVIEAWDEAASILKTGTKAQLYVPSDIGMGYASRPNIPSGSVLYYEIEILKIRSQGGF